MRRQPAIRVACAIGTRPFSFCPHRGLQLVLCWPYTIVGCIFLSGTIVAQLAANGALQQIRNHLSILESPFFAFASPPFGSSPLVSQSLPSRSLLRSRPSKMVFVTEDVVRPGENYPAFGTATVSQLPSEAPEGLAEYPLSQEQGDEVASGATRTGNRRFFGLGKKKDEGDKLKEVGSLSAGGRGPSTTAVGPTSAPFDKRIPPGSPPRPVYPYQHPSSPNRHCPSPSPGLPSPASSQIFERDVQESTLTAPSSPGVPAHIHRENHIPPVLEASSLAITDDHLQPEEVEIVTHSSHLPAAMTVAGTSSIEASIYTLPEEPVVIVEQDDASSNYGALDVNDVRRLSFVSFADVVHAEHAEQCSLRDSAHLPTFPSISHGNTANRSPSPVRSWASSQGLGTSPPTSGPVHSRGPEAAPVFSTKGSGVSTSPQSPPSASGELTVETMRQALRKTGSTDLNGVKSQPLSAISSDDGTHNIPWR